MPREQLIRLRCDYCDYSDTVPVDPTEADPRKLLAKLERWYGVVRALDPAGPQSADQTKWFDSLDCLVSGMKRDEAHKREAERLPVPAAQESVA